MSWIHRRLSRQISYSIKQPPKSTITELGYQIKNLVNLYLDTKVK